MDGGSYAIAELSAGQRPTVQLALINRKSLVLPAKLIADFSEEVRMFVDELTPFVRELARQPVAFCGGFFSGLFRLDLTEDPVKTWLNKQGAVPGAGTSLGGVNSSAPEGPQSIDID